MLGLKLIHVYKNGLWYPIALYRYAMSVVSIPRKWPRDIETAVHIKSTDDHEQCVRSSNVQVTRDVML